MIRTFATLLTAGGLVSSAIIGSAAPAYAQPVAAPQPALVDLINPLMGTDSDHALSYGNTYPAIAVPWGMNFWTPVTGKMGSGWGYTYAAKKINGIKQTHQPSPWMNDYAALALFAETGPLKI